MLEKEGERLICVFNFSGNNYSTVTLNVDTLPVENALCVKILGTDKAAASLDSGKITLSDLPAYGVQLYSVTL